MHNVEPELLAGIFIGYLIVAAFIFRASLSAGMTTTKGVARGFLAFVFVLCSFAGYGSEVLPVLAEAERVAHWVLMLLLVGLVVSLFMGADVFGDDS